MTRVFEEGWVPGKTTAPFNTPTATGTLTSFTLFRTSEPASRLMEGSEVRTNIGVFNTSTSMIAWAPVVYVSSTVLRRRAVPVTDQRLLDYQHCLLQS